MKHILMWSENRNDTVNYLIDPEEVEEIHFNESHSSVQTVTVFKYFDGSEFKQIINDQKSIIETRLAISENYVSLDEWNGQSTVTGDIGLHQHVRRINKKNEEETRDSCLYLICHYSQWQGELPKAQIVNKHELMKHLKKIDRNIHYYMKKIEQL